MPATEYWCFLTGQDEIESMASQIRKISKDEKYTGPPINVSVLYATLSSVMQREAFKPPTKGIRKVVLSTNIAETAVTIPGITCVIDSGKVKMKFYNPQLGLETLRVVNISKAQSFQRGGRCAREDDGFVYHMYTEEAFDEMVDHHLPEIQRASLASVVLQMLVMGMDPLQMDFMDKPDPEGITEAYTLLEDIGALVKGTQPPKVSDMALIMAQLPVDPRYAKVIISASELGCLREITIIMSLLSGDSVFCSSASDREQANEAKRKFFSPFGDHITLLNVYRAFHQANHKKKWCQVNYFNYKGLTFASKVYDQLITVCQNAGMQITSCGNNVDTIRQAMLCGLFMNVAKLKKNNKYKMLCSNDVVETHPSSVLFGKGVPFVIFTEIVQTTKKYMKTLTAVKGDWITLVAPSYLSRRKIDLFELVCP